MRLHLEVEGGDGIRGCCHKATEIARILGINVTFTHNDTRVHVTPGDNPEAAFDRLGAQSNRPRGAKIMTARKRQAQDTLWQAKLQFPGGGKGQTFLFREVDDMLKAASTAQDLLDSSPAAEMSGATIHGVEKIGRLWN